jgi:catechol O-methyltransferase
MKSTTTARLRALPALLRELGRTITAAIRREGNRLDAALAFARTQAKPGDPDSVLLALDRFAREKRILINVGDEKGLVLDAELKRIGPSARVLELGCFAGYSAIRMARWLRAPGKLISVEPNATSVRVARAMCELAGVADRVEISKGLSGDEIPKLSGSFDLVFLDHWKNLYRQDLERIEASGLLKPGSVVVADNVGPLFGADDYLGYVRNCGRYESRYVAGHVEYQETLEDGIEISIYRGGDPAVKSA